MSMRSPGFLVYALGAIALWAGLAALGLSLRHVPPFLLTGVALLVGSVLTWPRVWRQPSLWRVPARALAVGVYGLFGFHFLLFIALRLAPPVEANLINYLWPLLIVVLAPVFLPGVRLRAVHVVGALAGFAGAVLAITGGRSVAGGFSVGYVAALGSAFIWASYTLLTRRAAQAGASVPTEATGLFGLVSGVLALACHAALEPSASLSLRDGVLIGLMGLGPLGLAFLWWDRAIKTGDPRTLGVLSYLTPLLSTLLLTVITGRPWTAALAAAAALIIGAGALALRG